MDTAQQSFSLIAYAFGRVMTLFDMVFSKDNFGLYLIYAIIVYQVFRFLLMPLINGGFAGSDYASKKGGKQTKSKPSDKMSDKK